MLDHVGLHFTDAQSILKQPITDIQFGLRGLAFIPRNGTHLG